MNEQKTLEERKALLAQRVAAAVGLGARIESQSETMAVLVTGKPVNHILHFLLGFPTFGFWWLVWIFLAITGGEKRRVVTVDDYGNILEQGQGGGGGGVGRLPIVVVGGLILLVGIIALASSGGEDEPTSTSNPRIPATVVPIYANDRPTSTPRPISVPRPTSTPTPTLTLISKSCTSSYGYMTCEGFVQNTTASAMSNVMVVITWVDSNGVPQRTDEALIDYNPVLAGQQSPWSMIGNHNPALNRYRVSFKELLGGTIRHIDES